MWSGLYTASTARVTLLASVFVFGARLGAAQSTAGNEPRFSPLPCNSAFGGGSVPGIPATAVRCGTVVVPQNRRTPNDASLQSVVLPVVVYAMPGATGTPLVFLAGGPGESSIEGLQKVFLRTTTGQLALRERPIIAFDPRGHSPVFDRASPELGTILFRPRNPRSLAIAPLRDSLGKRYADLKKHGVDPANFTTREVLEDIADVTKALHYEKVVLFGVSYGSHYALRFMDLHPAMVEASILDAVAPPEATQLLDSAYVATAGRAIVQQIVTDCRTDPFCETQYQDLTDAVKSLSSATSIRKTVIAPGTGDWRTLEVSGATVLSVLGISAGSEDVLANVPRIITQFVASDTLRDDLSPRVLIAAAVDPALQTATWQAVPLTYWITLCGDRPNGEPLATNRQLCDVLGVPYDGEKASAPVRSDIPTLLISSGYDAQTPSVLADSAARLLSHSQRIHFSRVGHVAFARGPVMACAATIIQSFLQHPDQPPPTACVNTVAPAFMPRSGGR
jgi:pimeloyl-ACP methyl ester carboxylesterase